MLNISEQFFSVQGEGPWIGRPSLFLRTQGCNLLCGGKGTEKDSKFHNGATWRCDTLEVWKKGKAYSPEDIIEYWKNKGWLLKLEHGAHLVITGGEPLLQQNELIKLLDCIPFRVTVEIETNGTIAPIQEFDRYVAQYICSPKLNNSGMPKEKRIDNKVLEWFARSEKTIFKFVVLNEPDIVFMKNEFIVPFHIPNHRAFLMCASESRQQLIENSAKIADLAIKHNLLYTTRLQLLIWDRKTGV